MEFRDHLLPQGRDTLICRREPLGVKRSFLNTLRHTVCLGCAGVSVSAVAEESAVPKPNFLFVITDDQRWDAIGVVQKEQGDNARFPWFESPAMDRLAAEGVRFRNAFVTLSLCSPSRAAFLTGQYGHQNGVRRNNRGLPLKAVTHASRLRDAGYRTAYVGKWHMLNQRERPGYDYSASFIGQGIYQDCPFEINGHTTPTQGWVDDVSTDFAIDWIRKNRSQPFSLVLGFKSPHNQRGGEYLPPRLRHLYADKVSRPAPNMKTPPIFYGQDPDTPLQPHRFVANDAQLEYFRHMKGIDENLGRLLDTLDELNLTRNTVVVFTSDNGYFLGEHNCGDKRSLYEESLRIPMLVRYPPRFKPGMTVDDIVLNVDLAPTFLDLAGLPVPGTMQGRSWKPLALGGSPDDWRTSFVAHYYQELGPTPTCVALRTLTTKLVVYPSHPEWTEIFNLVDDPYEMRNLAHDRALRETLQLELETRMKEINLTMPGMPY